MSTKRFFASLAIAFFVSVSAVSAQSYIVALGDIPGTESLEVLLKTMGQDMAVTIKIEKVPMQRMVSMLDSKSADMGIPMVAIKDKEKQKFLPFDYSTESLQKMCFILYRNPSKPIDVEELKKGNPKGYKIESDISNAALFNFAVQPSSNPQGSLKKVNDGLIDGYIMGAASIDPVLRALKYKNIIRQLFDSYDIVFALRKDAKGGPVDKFLSDGLKKLKASGEFEKIMADALKTGVYEDWQP
jgi:hypothetical protein